MRYKYLCVIAIVALNINLKAAFNQTVGAGSAVSTADRTALFDSLRTGDPLSAYSEGLLSITTSGWAFVDWDPFNGKGNNTAYHYCSGGNVDWVTIQTTDGKAMKGIEFLYGNGWPNGAGGWGNDSATVDWQAYVGATQVAFGSTTVAVGTILGFSDANGFDSLRVRATLGTGDYQAIALDDLNVQLTAVPEPSTYLAGLSALGMLGLFSWRNRK